MEICPYEHDENLYWKRWKRREKGLNVGEDGRTLVSGFRYYATVPVSPYTAVSAVKSIRDSGVHVCAHACQR